jgi:prenyltransferase beta subunit
MGKCMYVETQCFASLGLCVCVFEGWRGEGLVGRRRDSLTTCFSWWCCAGLYNLITVSTVSANVQKGHSVCVVCD